MFEYILGSIAISWFITVMIKIILAKGYISEGFKYGGMPSGHSAVVVALATAIYLLEGLSTTFTLSFIFAIVTISDLMIIGGNPKKHTLRRHTFPQVIIGSFIGIGVAVLFRYLF